MKYSLKLLIVFLCFLFLPCCCKTNNTLEQKTIVETEAPASYLCVQDKNTGLYGLCNSAGEEILPCEYDRYLEYTRTTSSLYYQNTQNFFILKNEYKDVSLDDKGNLTEIMIPDSICEDEARLLSQNDFHIIESPVIYPAEPTSLLLKACTITISKENDSITYSFLLTLNNYEQEPEQSIAFYTDKLREGTRISLNNTTIPSDSYENEVMELTLKNSSNFIKIEYTEEYDPDQKYLIAYIPELSFLKHYFTFSGTTIYVECKTDVLPYVEGFYCDSKYKNPDNLRFSIFYDYLDKRSFGNNLSLFKGNPVIAFINYKPQSNCVYSINYPRANEAVANDVTGIYTSSSLNENELIYTVRKGEKLLVTSSGYENKICSRLNYIAQVQVPGTDIQGWIETIYLTPYVSTQDEVIINNLPVHDDNDDDFYFDEFYGPVLDYVRSIFEKKDMDKLVTYCDDVERFGFAKRDSRYSHQGYYNPLLFAVGYEWKEAFDYIIQKYPTTASIFTDFYDDDYGTPIAYACLHDNYYYVSELIKNGSPVVDMKSDYYSGMNDLITGVKDPRIIQLLKENGAELYYKYRSYYRNDVKCRALYDDNNQVKIYSTCNYNSDYTLMSFEDTQNLILESVGYEGDFLSTIDYGYRDSNDEYVTFGRWIEVSNGNIRGWLAPKDSLIPLQQIHEWGSWGNGC